MQEEREVKQEQLRYIYDFCKRKDIVFVDLRMELVDHLASRVEAIWKQEPDLSFELAFHRVYKSFGIFGMGTIVDEYSKVVWKKYWTLIKSEFGHWLKLPQVFAAILFMLVCYYSLESFALLGPIVWILIYSGIMGTFIYMLLKSKRLIKKMGGERSMLLSSPRYFWLIIHLLYLMPLNHFHVFFTASIPLPTTLMLSFSLVFAIANLKILKLAQDQTDSLKERMQYYLV
jgi:hypothetical protein